MFKELQKYLKKFGLETSESTTSMILGALVVILVATMVYGYFKNQQSVSNPVIPPPVEETTDGELTPPTNTETIIANSPITISNYTVVTGDCLWTIAERAYGNPYKWVDIAAANNLADPNLIHPGNVFSIPR
jgi:nucleoid-associated protein YgaU